MGPMVMPRMPPWPRPCQASMPSGSRGDAVADPLVNNPNISTATNPTKRITRGFRVRGGRRQHARSLAEFEVDADLVGVEIDADDARLVAGLARFEVAVLGVGGDLDAVLAVAIAGVFGLVERVGDELDLHSGQAVPAVCVPHHA